MGKAVSDVQIPSLFLHNADMCELNMAGQLRIWLYTQDSCILEEWNLVDHARSSSEVLSDVKVFFLMCILLTPRFCNDPCTERIVCKKSELPWKVSKSKLLWSTRAWSAICVALAFMFLIPSFQPWTPVEEMRRFGSPLQTYSNNGHSRTHSRHSSITSRSAFDAFSFREAPSVRNGNNCSFAVSNALEDSFICDVASVHVAMTLDSAYLRGSMAAVFSILQHASCPENVVFHFLVTDEDSGFGSLVRSTFPFLKFKIYHFDESLVRNRISASVRQALEQPLNYARNYMADLFEHCVRRVIYLDSDLIVVDDIFKLWATSLGSRTVGAPEYCHANFAKYFLPSFWMDGNLSCTFVGRSPCYFNTGVMIIDLMKWRQQNYTLKIEWWMEVQKERRIYDLGSLPPFLLVFAGLVEPVEHRWNQHGLGGDNVKGSCRPLHPGPVSLLHWSGEGKPWKRLDSQQPCPLDSIWVPYDLYVQH